MGITLSGHVVVPAADLEAVKARLPDHIRLTLAEPGCLSFDVRPAPNDPGRYLVNEHFRDRAAFDAHQARVKSSDWGRATAHLARKYEISG